jgi:hypothetical protein
MLDSVVNNYTVFFTGENHLHRKSNYMLQLKMLKYLHQKAGVRHLFLEFGYSRGYLVNRYVHTGDSTLFNILSDYSYDEYALLYKGIWEYNKTLDSNNRIIVSGIDVERSYNTSAKLLEMFLPAGQAPAAIEIHIEAIKALAKMSDKKMQESKDNTTDDMKFKGENISQAKTMNFILKSVDSIPDVWKDYLGNNYNDFCMVLNGIKAEKLRSDYLVGSTPYHYIYREQYMYLQLLALVEKYPNEKFYGQFGRCHTPINEQEYWCGYYFLKTLASRINHSNNERVKGKVLSIATYYPEGTMFEKKVTEQEKLNKIIDNIKLDTLTILAVTNDTAVFGKFKEKYQYLIINKFKQTDDVVKKEKPSENNNNQSNQQPDYVFFINGKTGLFFTQQNDLNKTLNNLYPGNIFNMQLYSWGIEMGWSENAIANVNFSYDNYLTQTIYPIDSISFKFKGSKFLFRFGPEITRSNTFNLSPQIGLGYAGYTFVQRLGGSSNTDMILFNAANFTQYKFRNPAFILEGLLEIRMNLFPFTVALQGGYTYDVSKKSWRYKGTNLPDGIKSSHTGAFINFCLGFMLDLS